MVVAAQTQACQRVLQALRRLEHLWRRCGERGARLVVVACSVDALVHRVAELVREGGRTRTVGGRIEVASTAAVGVFAALGAVGTEPFGVQRLAIFDARVALVRLAVGRRGHVTRIVRPTAIAGDAAVVREASLAVRESELPRVCRDGAGGLRVERRLQLLPLLVAVRRLP